MQDSPLGTLSVVSTPIGNLEDMTLRAIRVLKEADMILCEDTRVTKKLLDHYDIDTPTMSYHAHSKLSKADKILEMIEEGKHLALVSDAGTPTISDPGVLLIQQVRHAFKDGVRIESVPGPTALISALSISGISSAHFQFLGFLPQKKGRETLFVRIASSDETTVFYESPHRILKTLASLQEHLDDSRTVVIAKELTKIHENIISGTPHEVHEYFFHNPDKIRGEFVVIISGKTA